MAITNSLNSGIANTTPSTIQKKTAGLVAPKPTWQEQLRDVQSTYFANNPTTPRTPVAAAPQQQTSSSPGAYKGVAITPGSMQDIQAQMARIDGQGQVQQAPAPQPLAMNRATTPPQTQPTNVRGLFPDIISSLANRYAQPSAAVLGAQERYGKAVDTQQKLKSDIAEQTGAIESDPIPLEFQQGRKQALSRQYASQLEAGQAAINEQQQAIQLGLNQQQLEQQALQTAAGLTQPQVTAFGQTVFNPATGTFDGGGGDMTQAIGKYAELAASNGITPAQIPSSITGNPILMAQFLEQAKRVNPSFNPAQWEAAVQAIQTDITQTGSLGGPLSKAAGSAYQALDTLQSSYDQLSSLQQGQVPFLGVNVPILSSLAQQTSLALGAGREEASMFQGALNEARAQVSAVLAPVIGVDAARSASVGLLPDNMTPQEIPQKITAAKEYINQRVQSFTTPGGTSSQTPTQGSSIYSW